MGNLFNKDFNEFLQLLAKHGVDYILVGGYSVVLHGYPRTTGDLDLWIRQTKKNYLALQKVFVDFGMPIMKEEDFLASALDVFTYGRPPQAIDIMTQCKGLNFETAFEHSNLVQVDEISIRLISYADLILAKRSAGRFKDLNDIEHLES
jgi:hypothetical protein